MFIYSHNVFIQCRFGRPPRPTVVKRLLEIARIEGFEVGHIIFAKNVIQILIIAIIT